MKKSNLIVRLSVIMLFSAFMWQCEDSDATAKSTRRVGSKLDALTDMGYYVTANNTTKSGELYPDLTMKKHGAWSGDKLIGRNASVRDGSYDDNELFSIQEEEGTGTGFFFKMEILEPGQIVSVPESIHLKSGFFEVFEDENKCEAFVNVPGKDSRGKEAVFKLCFMTSDRGNHLFMAKVNTNGFINNEETTVPTLEMDVVWVMTEEGKAKNKVDKLYADMGITIHPNPETTLFRQMPGWTVGSDFYQEVSAVIPSDNVVDAEPDGTGDTSVETNNNDNGSTAKTAEVKPEVKEVAVVPEVDIPEATIIDAPPPPSIPASSKVSFNAKSMWLLVGAGKGGCSVTAKIAKEGTAQTVERFKVE